MSNERVRSSRSLPAAMAATVGLALACTAGPDSVDEVHEDGLAIGMDSIRADDLAAHVEILASDAFGGRFPGTDGETKTVAYVSARLARAGVLPAAGGSYLQEVPLAEVTIDRQSRMEIAGGGEERTLRFPDEVVLGGGPPGERTTADDCPVVFAGYGIVAPEYGWDDYGDVDLAGRAVVVLWGEPDLGDGDDAPFKGRALTNHGTRHAKRQAAAARGAAALVVVHETERIGVTFELLAGHGSRPSYELATAGGTDAAILDGLLPRDAAAELLALGGADLHELSRSAGERGFAARPIDVTASFDVASASSTMVSHNVVGILPGRTRPDEYVVYTAHWDHVGTSDEAGDEAAEDGIFNGAVDNATGTSALLELADAFAALPQRPERSIVFIATTSEEQGLLGAYHYVAHPLFPLEDTVAVINMDGLFPFGETRGLTVVAMGSSEVEEYLDAGAAAVGRRLYPDSAPEMGAFFRSDHYPFAVKGVPAVFAVGGPAPDPDAGETVDVQRWIEYVTEHYHRPSDEYDADTWDLAGIVQDVRIYFHAGYSLAMAERFPNWHADSEFRALRDAMRAGATPSAAASRAR